MMRRYWTSSRWPAAWALTMLLALALVGSIFATRLLILAQASVAGGLASRGVLVRAGASLGREGCLRVTVGTAHENEKFVAALRECLAGA